MKHTHEIGEEGWFLILEFLTSYIQKVASLNYQTKNEQANADKLKDFVSKRKASIKQNELSKIMQVLDS